MVLGAVMATAGQKTQGVHFGPFGSSRVNGGLDSTRIGLVLETVTTFGEDPDLNMEKGSLRQMIDSLDGINLINVSIYVAVSIVIMTLEL